MPKYHSHLSVGIIVCSVMAIVLIKFGCNVSAIWFELFMWGAFGSIFPDVDTKSKAQQLTYYLLFITICCLVLGGRHTLAALVGGIALLPHVVNHRSIFHRGWFLVGLTGLGIVVSCSVFPFIRTKIMLSGLFFLGGALSHIVLDSGWSAVVRR